MFRLTQNGHHLAGDIFKHILLKEIYSFLDKTSSKYCLIDNKPALVLIMAWRQTGDKPLSELMMAQFTDEHMHQWATVNLILSSFKDSQAVVLEDITPTPPPPPLQLF